ncbi:LamG-like jellyroll fold domain-containing protein [Chondrinema litorale]|uniref:LamG-like jellyroll fold domain-containing protein n=1 Tax=Chondrinema litorale TaxID=2994555 RepID=UPI002543C586|nr:LamG-like jellyroll fold domain-containing protein [Chondrinema litorale]UZR98485.1 T9SS type A sorting domain-containing protein [Chondrinema litorale]
MKKLVLLILIALYASTLSAQTGYTSYSIGYLGGQQSLKEDTGDSMRISFSGGNVISTPKYYNIEDKADVMAGFPFNIGYFPLVFNKELFVSKGYFADYISLEWSVMALQSRIERFLIFRKPLGSIGDSLLVANVAADEYSWKDELAEKGQLYKYTIFAKGIADNLLIPYINVVEGVGFAFPVGTVSGTITYEGGTSVEGVVVMAETNGNLAGKSMYLNGSDAYLSIAHEDKDKELEIRNGFTFQAWCRLDESQGGVLFSKGDQYEVSLSSSTTVDFRVKDATVSLPFMAPVDSFFHISASYDPNDSLKLVVHTDDESRYTISVAAGQQPLESDYDDIYIGKDAAGTGTFFKGYVDEIRLWNTPLTEEEIASNFSRYIAGTEDNLVGYWRLNTGLSDQFFDAARNGYTFYENHGWVWRGTWSEMTPLQSQLAYKGITDEVGNYTISGFPYETDGSQYTFTPMFGVHSFEPKQMLRFVGDGASIHNGIDFKDVSSFKVSGTVWYENTYFPVEGVSIKIDGQYAVNGEGELIQTDNLGQFRIDVPIGYHALRLEKNQHGFAYEGRFPAPDAYTADDEIPQYDFQEPIIGLEFFDTTLVKVVGRVAGGPVEEAKPIGFGESVNNLGNASIVLATEKGYDVTQSDKSVNYPIGEGSSKVEFSTKTTTIQPDSETGEYVAYLLPEKYTVTNITAGNYIYGNEFQVTIDLGATIWEDETLEDTLKVVIDEVEQSGYPPYNEADYDSIYTVSRLDTILTIGKSLFSYQHKQNFIYRETPTIEVTNPYGIAYFGDNTLFGDSTFVYKDTDLGIEKSIPLVKSGAYSFGHPVFTQRKNYYMSIALFESYTNADNGLTDKVPVVDGELEIVNDLAIDTDKQTIQLDNSGKATYQFSGGLPEVTIDNTTPENSFTKTLSITAFSGNEGGIKTIWRDGNPFRGYVFGGMPTGNNFVTTGPTEIVTILRDPPGSNSFAYMEQNESFSKVRSWNVENTFSLDNSITYNMGMQVKTVNGIGTAVVTDIETENSIEAGLNIETSWTEDFEQVITTTTTKRWQTSSDIGYVSSDGDVFVGYATNIVYGKSLNLELIPDIECAEGDCSTQTYMGYKLGIKEGVRLNPEFNTGFIFTQDYIINTLIPNLKEVRNSFLSYSNTPNSVVAKDKPLYISLVPPTDERFGTDNADKNAWKENAAEITNEKDLGNGPSYIVKLPQSYVDNNTFVTDSIDYYNQQISEWEYWLAENEKQKIEAQLIENISFDGGANYEQSVSYDTSSVYSYSFRSFINPYVLGTTGESFNSFGLSVDFGRSYSSETNNSSGSEESKTTTYGYLLEDNESAQTFTGTATDYYSIDIKKPKDGFGPVFSVRGGATSCPYEGDEFTKYYEAGKYTLHSATLQTEKPDITVEQAIVSDISENYPAEFILYLKNNSETENDIWYELLLDDSTNPYGAELEIDGTPIGNGRTFMVKAGTTLQKTLKLYKGQSDKYDYEDILLYLNSICDGYIGSEVSLSAYFKPGCTDIELESPADQWVINTETVPEDTMTVKISGYDIEQDNFERVLFQYKPAGLSTWTTNMIFYNQKKVAQENYDAADEPKAWFNSSTINYLWDMTSLPDREYDVRVVSVCVLGPGSEVETATPAVRGIKDVKRPLLFGSPQPADGILSANDEIMIQFDEDIEAGLLTSANFSIQGVLNSYEINNNTSVSLDGIQDYIKISDGLELGNKSYSIEFWLRKNAMNKEEVVFSKGTLASDVLEFGFTSDNKVFIEIAGERFTTAASFTETDWHHFALVYDQTKNQFTIYRDDNYILEEVVPEKIFSGSGAIVLGKSIITNSKHFTGNIHDLRVWSKKLSLSSVYANMYQHFSGLEVGLIGYWPLDEARGNKATDKARYRNALLFADWEVTPKGKSYVFDGIDDYLEINTASTVVITPEMDFSIEFWFKADVSQSDVVLFSSGKGDGTDQLNNPAYSMSIGLNNQGELYMLNNGAEIVASGNNYLDGDWHHFALSLNRLSNTNIYLDGDLIKSSTSSDFGGLSGAKMWIGARGYLSNASIDEQDKFFKGNIDEFRIWTSARKQASVELDIVSKLNGDEMGLVAYYPFESYQKQVTGNILLEATLSDQWQNPYGDNAGLAISYGGSDFSDDAPNLKDARPVTKVDYTWVVNDDKIIITPSAGMTSVIEKSILELSIDRIEDKYGNRIASPVTWTAYVDKNQLKWSESSLSLENELYNEYTFDVDIINNGGTEQTFNIDNLPAWLDANPQSGELDPLSSKTVTFTVNEGLNTGYYSEDIFLKGDFEFDEKLHIDLRVYTAEPAWEVNVSDFQYSMNVVGQLKINGVLSSDKYDKISAFVNDECRGVANLEYVEEFDLYLAFLDIYSNSVSGEKIELRVWNADEGTEHRNVTPNYTFVDNAVWGTPSVPQLIEANGTYLQKLDLDKGWNWISFNLNSTDLKNINTLFAEIENQQGDQIKGQTDVDIYTSQFGWNGTLSSEGGFKVGNLYKVKTSNAGSIDVIGTAIDPTVEIPINTGWNWIGYNPRFSMDINEAFTNFNPHSGDVVKNQQSFSIYENGIGWIGSLNYLIPGEGYMFQSSNIGTLTYPEVSLLNSSRIREEHESSPWEFDANKYSDNMSVIASIEGVDSEEYVLGAFINEEHRGYAYPINIESDQSLYFINIIGETDDELIKFKILHQDDNKTYDIANTLEFKKNVVKGALSEPILLSLGENTIVSKSKDYKVYPNPFTQILSIIIPETLRESTEVKVNDLLGREVIKFSNKDISDSGLIEWNGRNSFGDKVSTGIYFIVINSSEGKVTFKITKE